MEVIGDFDQSSLRGMVGTETRIGGGENERCEYRQLL